MNYLGSFEIGLVLPLVFSGDCMTGIRNELTLAMFCEIDLIGSNRIGPFSSVKFSRVQTLIFHRRASRAYETTLWMFRKIDFIGVNRIDRFGNFEVSGIAAGTQSAHI